MNDTSVNNIADFRWIDDTALVKSKMNDIVGTGGLYAGRLIYRCPDCACDHLIAYYNLEEGASNALIGFHFSPDVVLEFDYDLNSVDECRAEIDRMFTAFKGYSILQATTEEAPVHEPANDQTRH